MSDFVAKRRLEITDVDWNKVVFSDFNSHFFQHASLLNALSLWAEYDDFSFGISTKSGDLIAVVPLMRFNYPYFKIFHKYAIHSFGLLACSSDLTKELSLALYKFALQHIFSLSANLRCKYIDFRFFFRQNNSFMFKFLNANVNAMSKVESETWMINLDCSLEDIWKSIFVKQRNTIKKAQKIGLNVREAEPKDLTVYYSLHLESCKRNSIKPHPFHYFKAIWEICVEQRNGLILVGEYNGEVISGQTFYFHQNQATYWTGASNSAALRFGVNSLIQWNAIQFCHNHKFMYFENGLVSDVPNSKSHSISRFKESFGGTRQPLYSFRMYSYDINSSKPFEST